MSGNVDRTNVRLGVKQQKWLSRLLRMCSAVAEKRITIPFQAKLTPVLFFKVKVLNPGLQEVTGDTWHDLQEPAIGDGGYAFDPSMVISDEF